ncbi:hypothetical protein C7M84_024562 [Penaeus vannamei]|uniref:Uncharacterized protein n=1 Tax=Penaeus vannamei TaxID=6689 RepID=A0A3R7QL27_PENVA|nr:hypothetical protein C7M84_024562 [Penaeus vannamei]
MDVDEHQDESSEQYDEMSSEESTHKACSAERNQQSSPFSETSPTRNFKSSYAKSLADSYRRASLPVVVGSPKGQFYFKNDEFLSLNARPARLSGFGQDKYVSLNTSSTRSPSLPGFEPLSLPTILDVVPEPQELQQEVRESKSTTRNLYSQLLNEEEVFVPYERLQKFCEEGGSNFSLQDWHSLGSLITSDGRKLVKLSDFQERVKKHKPSKLIENGYPNVNGGEKDAQVEGLRLERGQLEGRIEQLCDVLAERDNTVQRLEEDLLRIRMHTETNKLFNTKNTSRGHSLFRLATVA